MGEIAEALKRSREEREARKTVAAEQAAAGRSAPAAPPGRSELLDALREAASARDAEARRSAGAAAERAEAAPSSTTTSSSAAPSDSQPNEPFELGEPCLAAIGKPDLHRHLALAVASQLERRSARSLCVVSALRGEGKTTVSTTLAIALASLRSGRSVAIVDLDLRNPSVARRLGVPRGRGPGVEQFLLGHADLTAVRVPVVAPQLDVYPSIEPQREAHELLAHPRFSELVAWLEQRYETILFDTPPTLIVPDASLILKHVHYCVTVARAGVSRVRRFEEMLDVLPADAVIGKVLNSATLSSAGRYDYEYGYGAQAQAEAEAEAQAAAAAAGPSTS